jgi:protein XRP2
MKKKLDRRNYIFSGVTHQTLVKLPEQISGQSFLIDGLSDCHVFLCDRIAALYIENCHNCRIYSGPVGGSVFVRNCSDSLVATAAQQLRISHSQNIQAFVFSETHTTLEETTGLVIAPYHFDYPGISGHFKQTEIDTSVNKAFLVLDFTPKPGNFRVMDVAAFHASKATFAFENGTLKATQDVAELPVDFPIHFGGKMLINVFQNNPNADPTNDSGMASFKMGTQIETAEAESRTRDVTEVTLKVLTASK